ncbi:TerB family tellurite resistance protein [Chelatococcus daeguensis]|nr:TerB family tellurite resistance protein [Chelatococcus daeguensis]MBM3081935.1 TerB family tellurite resistance protein [Chelatococcus daeguensis]
MTRPVRLIASIARLFERLPRHQAVPPREDRDRTPDTLLSLAIVLVHIAGGDGRLTGEERARLADLVGRRFRLSPREALRIIEAAIVAEGSREDVDDAFEDLKRLLPPDGRRELMAAAWELAKIDGHVAELEDDLLWRSARRLGLSEREAEALRQSALTDVDGGV